MSVEQLFIYPIKSCGGIKVEEALVTKYGLALPLNPDIVDRRWMIIKDERFQSQRVRPRMALIQPSFVKDGLCLRAPNMPELYVPVNPLPDEVVHCYCWKYPILGLRYGDHISHWLRTFFETEDDLDLVVFDYKQFEGRQCKNSSDPNSARDGDVSVYHDMGPINLCSTKSLYDLNTRMEKKIKLNNFRPNIFVTNVTEPYAEDCWREIEIGKVKLTWIAACIRCLLPTVDQETGIKDPNQEPLKTLKTYRLKPIPYDVSPLFGINMAPTEENSIGAIIRVGDLVQVKTEELDFWSKNDSVLSN
ncbi:unnamed protein product [Adineta steineri]|uniref:MOSC domain-containing protein n=1 Tax=Adineta steineri TaxID=433720 RepID=A0A819QDJ4_9BILA|nr:unnamed protein product [Adineta steineri]